MTDVQDRLERERERRVRARAFQHMLDATLSWAKQWGVEQGEVAALLRKRADDLEVVCRPDNSRT